MIVLRGLIVLSGLALAACAAHPAASPATAAMPSGNAGETPLQLLSAVQNDADRLDVTQDATLRSQLLDAATQSAQQCLQLAANDAACLYAQAQVQGLTARERPLQAAGLLKDMLGNLAKAEALDPRLDHAGPARLSAVVLMRAPPWPLGPGDIESAVTAAQRAVHVDPQYPPNLITLAQAQTKSDGAPQARATFARAQAAVRAWQDDAARAGADRAHWQRDIDQGLHDLP